MGHVAHAVRIWRYIDATAGPGGVRPTAPTSNCYALWTVHAPVVLKVVGPGAPGGFEGMGVVWGYRRPPWTPEEEAMWIVRGKVRPPWKVHTDTDPGQWVDAARPCVTITPVGVMPLSVFTLGPDQLDIPTRTEVAAYLLEHPGALLRTRS